MLKEAVASKAAKLLMTCVCPVAGTTALTLGVPQVRDAVHKAAQPRQYAKPKTRVRAVQEAEVQVAQAETPCPTVTPLAMSDIPVTAPEVGLPSTVAQLADAPQASQPSQFAEAPSLDSGVPLTSRIFVARPDAVSSTAPADESDGARWVKLILGFGVIGVPRVAYRRNGSGRTNKQQG